MPPPRPRPSLTDIAKAAGVSIATVSNAMSGKGRVSPEVAERIRGIAASAGYTPSQAARALRTGRSGVLGLVLADIANPLFPQIAQAIERAAAGYGYGVLIGDSRGEIAAQTEAVERLIERGADGLIVIPRRGTRIGDIGRPVAVIDSPATPGNTVSSDHRAGGRAIAEHLLGLGHRRILILGGDPASIVQGERIGGMRAGFAGRAEIRVVWLGGDDPGLDEVLSDGATAIAAVSDLIALRVMTALQRAGVAVPAQVSVTGFDDLVWSSVVSPGLTTMRQDLPAIAAIAVRHLVDIIEGGGPAGPPPDAAGASGIPMRLVVRASTGPAPAGPATPGQGDRA